MLPTARNLLNFQTKDISVRDDQIVDFYYPTYPVLEKLYPCPIWILFWLKPY